MFSQETYAMTQSPMDWIGLVPLHWQLTRFGDVIAMRPKKSVANVPPGALSFGRVVEKKDDFPEETKSTYQEVLPGDFLINPINLNYDLKSLRTAKSDVHVCVSPAYIVATASQESPDFIKWLLYDFDLRHMKTLGAGVRQTLTFQDVKKCLIHMPPLLEQQSIANFLDRETSIIDQKIALISRKQGLLAELRKATIHDAVTRGVANGQPLKASGIKWIDDIPTSWTVKRLKEISKFESGWTPESKNQEYYGGDIPWATIGDLPKSRVINETKNKISSSAVDKFNMRPIAAGTLLFSFKLSIGQVAFTGCEMFTNEAIAAFRELSISKDFAYYAFPVFVTKNCKENIYGAPLLNRELMLNSFIPIPSTEEQKDIVQYLDREIHRIDQMASLAKRQIELLQEQRKALIHEVVTGKMRVI